jgi:hypothetical protein
VVAPGNCFAPFLLLLQAHYQGTDRHVKASALDVGAPVPNPVHALVRTDVPDAVCTRKRPPDPFQYTGELQDARHVLEDVAGLAVLKHSEILHSMIVVCF